MPFSPVASRCKRGRFGIRCSKPFAKSIRKWPRRWTAKSNSSRTPTGSISADCSARWATIGRCMQPRRTAATSTRPWSWKCSIAPDCFEAQEKLLAELSRRPRRARGRTVPVEIIFAGQTIYHFDAPGVAMPVAPAWCLTEKQLIIGLYPQAVKAVLSRTAGRKIARDLAAVKPLLTGQPAPLSISYYDTRELFEASYWYAQVVDPNVPWARCRSQGLPSNSMPGLLPSPRSDRQAFAAEHEHRPPHRTRVGNRNPSDAARYEHRRRRAGGRRAAIARRASRARSGPANAEQRTISSNKFWRCIISTTLIEGSRPLTTPTKTASRY